MKRFVALALSLGLAAGPIHAGGPVVVVEEAPVVVEEAPPSSKGFLPLLVVPLVLCIVMCGPEEDDS
ncbi:MAG TPA: hypothetical protein VK146_10910 [Tabrizicola sp.]|nr:hypothetical protein [Tabrizicola sp.]